MITTLVVLFLEVRVAVTAFGKVDVPFAGMVIGEGVAAVTPRFKSEVVLNTVGLPSASTVSM
jgi:hypothetical protein